MGSRRILQLLKEGSLQIWRMVEVAKCLPTLSRNPPWPALGLDWGRLLVSVTVPPEPTYLGTAELPARNGASPLVQLHQYQRVEGEDMHLQGKLCAAAAGSHHTVQL